MNAQAYNLANVRYVCFASQDACMLELNSYFDCAAPVTPIYSLQMSYLPFDIVLVQDLYSTSGTVYRLPRGDVS